MSDEGETARVANSPHVGPRTTQVHQAAFSPQPKRVRAPRPRPTDQGRPTGPARPARFGG